MILASVPLRGRLLLLAAAGILPLALAVGVGLVALAHQQRGQAERAGLEISRALMTAVNAELDRTFAVMDALTVARTLERGDLRGFHRLVSEVVKRDPTWLTILLADANGRLLVDAGASFGAPLGPVIERDSFDQVLRTRAPTVGYQAKGRSGAYAVPLRMAVVRGGKVRYVLSIVIKPDGIRAVVDRQRLPADWVVSVFDGKARRVARSRQHEEYLGGPPAPELQKLMQTQRSEGVLFGATLEGDMVYTAFTRSASTGWSVAIGIPEAYVAATVRRSVALYGGGILLSLAFAVAAALLIGRGVARPMEELSAAARALGRREPVVPPRTPIREIAQVGQSLVTAADERKRGDAEREELLAREQQARAIAEAANRSKDEFLAMLGHELRNPLGAIANAAQLLEARDDAARSHAAAVIGRQVRHLSRMTDDLLDAARAMTGKIVLQRHPLDLAEAAERALGAVRSSERSRGRRLAQVLEPVWVDADPTRIEQIAGNLLSNAVKFTPAGSTITVSVKREGGDAVLRVADDGIGMAPELAARAFEPFVQGERALDRSQGGLGIGLTLVRRLAELHGGSAEGSSDGPGRGSVFTVRLPAVQEPAVSKTRQKAQSASAPRDVLIVEDNEDARDTLRRLLEMDGHRVRVASDGLAGLEAVLEAPPEIALIDVGLPRMDGYELARRIRGAQTLERRPYLVAITGYGLPEDRARTRDAGFDLHLVKPVDAGALGSVLAKI